MTGASYDFTFIDGYADDPELSRTKGWVAGTLTLDDGRAYQLYFVTLHRLSQDASAEFARGMPFYAEPNMILVAEIDTEHVLTAVQTIVSNEYTENLRPDRA